MLDKPVNGITPVKLPPAGLLDQMKADGTLTGTLFTSVGYGTQEPQQAPGGIQNAFDGQRRFAVGEFDALNRTYLRISQNVHTGDGGTCSGDSGGPQFLGAGADETEFGVVVYEHSATAGTLIASSRSCADSGAPVLSSAAPRNAAATAKTVPTRKATW